MDSDRGFVMKGLCGAVPPVLLSAVHIDGIKGVCCVNGPNMVSYGQYSYKGEQFLPYHEYESKELFNLVKPGVMELRDSIAKTVSTVPHHPSSAIPFEHKSDVAFMFVAGLDDKDSPSEMFANETEQRLRAADHPDYEIIRYPGAGHLLEPTNFPLNPCMYMADNIRRNFGGKPFPHAKAQRDYWLRYIDFVKRVLHVQNE